MNYILKSLLDSFVIVFTDDILVYWNRKEEYVGHFCIALGILKVKKLYEKFLKCEFWLFLIAF